MGGYLREKVPGANAIHVVFVNDAARGPGRVAVGTMVSGATPVLVRDYTVCGPQTRECVHFWSSQRPLLGCSTASPGTYERTIRTLGLHLEWLARNQNFISLRRVKRRIEHAVR